MIPLLLSFLLIGRAARAEGCRFQNRAKDPLFSALPREVFGWVNCPRNEFSSLNIIYVARLPAGDGPLKAWLRAYARNAVPATTGFRFREESRQTPGNTWLEAFSARAVGGATHFIFTVPDGRGGIYAFVYTDTVDRARHYKTQVQSLRLVLTSAESVSMLNTRLKNDPL